MHRKQNGLDIVLKTISETLIFTAKQLPYILIGLFLAELIVALKWISKLTLLTKPIMRYGHLNPGCGIPFLTAFASPPAANSMLLGFHKENKITSRELFFAVLVNSFPSALMHWRWWLPAILSVLGNVGLLYFGLIVIAEILRVLIFLTAARFVLQKSGSSPEGDKEYTEKISWKEAVAISFEGTKKMSFRILKIFVPVTFIVLLLVNVGFITMLADCLQGIATCFPIPIEGVPIIAAQFGNSLVAFAIAGNLFSQNIITAKDVVLTLFVGRIFAAVIIAIRMQIPMVVGIFGQKIGFQIIGSRLASTIVIDLVMIFLIYFSW